MKNLDSSSFLYLGMSVIYHFSHNYRNWSEINKNIDSGCLGYHWLVWRWTTNKRPYHIINTFISIPHFFVVAAVNNELSIDLYKEREGERVEKNVFFSVLISRITLLPVFIDSLPHSVADIHGCIYPIVILYKHIYIYTRNYIHNNKGTLLSSKSCEWVSYLIMYHYNWIGFAVYWIVFPLVELTSFIII